MTQEIHWGPAIAVDGKRPGFVREDDIFQAGGSGFDWYGNLSNGTPHIWNQSPNREPNWNAVDRIRLPADHPYYRQTEEAPIDWSGELEAVHEDGRTMPITGVHDWGNDRWPHAGVADLEHIYMRDDGRCSRATWGDMPGWRIRNVSQPTPQADTKPDLTARMEALVRWAAKAGPDAEYPERLAIATEACVIEGMLPKPVDPDEQYARDLIREQGWSGEREIGSEAVVAMIVKTRRALALAGEKEA